MKVFGDYYRSLTSILFTLNALGYPVYVDHVLEVPMATLQKILKRTNALKKNVW